jgi:hypothetical protein
MSVFFEWIPISIIQKYRLDNTDKTAWSEQIKGRNDSIPVQEFELNWNACIRSLLSINNINNQVSIMEDMVATFNKMFLVYKLGR